MSNNAVLETLASLFAKANDSASTEAEAEAAMKIAAKIMKKNMIEESEVLKAVGSIGKTSFVSENIPMKGKQMPDFYKYGVAYALAKFVGVEHFVRKSNISGLSMNLFGEKDKIELFKYFNSMIDNVAEKELTSFRETFVTNAHGRTVRASFMLGFYSRVKERIEAMTATMKEEIITETGTSIIVLKDKELADGFRNYSKENGFRIKTQVTKASYSNSSAFSAGTSRGDNVSFGKAIK